MHNPDLQENKPPAGYPSETPTNTKRKWFRRTQMKGERGFIEGCLFALCCCWLCETCC